MLKLYVVLLLALSGMTVVIMILSALQWTNTKSQNDHDSETATSPTITQAAPTNTQTALAVINQTAPAVSLGVEVLCQLESDWSLMPVACRVAKHQRNGEQPLFQESFVATLNQSKLFDEPQLPQLYCELALLHTHLCHRNESALACVRRVGAQRLEMVLSARCSQSMWFQAIVAEEKQREASQRTYRSKLYPLLSGGIIPDSIVQPIEPGPYISPERRPSANMPAPRNTTCSMIHRLPMSIPEEVIVDSVERDKFFDFYPMLPVLFPKGEFKVRRSFAFGSQDEAVCRELIARSYFAWTHRRGCFTAQRHLDILASGTVPFFVDLNRCSRILTYVCLGSLHDWCNARCTCQGLHGCCPHKISRSLSLLQHPITTIPFSTS